MKIYKITIDNYSYDCYGWHVIIANSQTEVIDIAKTASADEWKEIWETARIEILWEYAWPNTEPFIALSDFNAG